MEISVIIPTYKPQSYVWECLDSLVNQTLSKDDFEVIVILNGEKEPYYSQLNEYINDRKNDISIKLLFSDLKGVSHARNIGLDSAQGRYIAFIDDDDFISPTYLEDMLSKADEGTIVVSNTYYFREERKGECISNRMRELFMIMAEKGRTDYITARRFLFNTPMKLIPAGIIGKRRFDPSFSIGEDCIFMFLISDKMSHITFSDPNSIYYRRIRESSSISTHSKGKQFKVLVNDLKQMCAYTLIYLTGMRRYSFFFYLTRIRGSFHWQISAKKSH